LKIKNICEKIWEIERKYDLLNQQIQGVYFWKLIRFQLYKNITRSAGIFEVTTQFEQSIFQKIKDLPIVLINTYFYSAYKKKSKKDILIFESGRKILVNNKYIDIYTEVLIKKLNDENKNYEIIDLPHLRKHYNKPDKVRSYYEHIYINYIFQRLFAKIKLSENELNLIFRIEKDLNLNFGINILLKNLIENTIKLFKLEKKYHKKLLVKRKVKKVYLVCSYGRESIIQACKENNIECIELQHGTMGKYHLGYSFPYNNEVPYFPDKIYLFGQFWYDNTPLPIKPENIEIVGYSYLEQSIRQFRKLGKVKNQILFISQWTIGTQLCELAYQLAKNNSNFRIFYKLHPSEYNKWEAEYPILSKANKLNNFFIVNNNDINLYKLFAESEYVIGCYSTALFEALTLNCKAILADLPGIEFMEYLIENGFSKLAKDYNDIIKIINQGKFKKIDRNYFFKEI